MPATVTRADRKALRQYLRKFSWATQDYLRTPLQRIRADLRHDTLAAAGEIGMGQALADLGDPRALADRFADEHGRRGVRGARLGVRILGGALAVACVVGAVIGLRALPRVENAGQTWTDEWFQLDPNAWEPTYLATDPADGSATMEITVRNPGPFPETITGVDTEVSRTTLHPTGPGGTIDGTQGPAQRTLTVPAGEVAVLRLTISLPCAPVAPDTTIGFTGTDLRVTMIGITRTVTVPLGANVGLRTTEQWEPPPGCVPGELG